MAKTKSTKDSLKRLFAWVDPFTHARLKAMAAMRHIYLEDLISEAVSEYLDRHEGDGRP
jgi:predicted HicB family RNase H-like nuclease